MKQFAKLLTALIIKKVTIIKDTSFELTEVGCKSELSTYPNSTADYVSIQNVDNIKKILNNNNRTINKKTTK